MSRTIRAPVLRRSPGAELAARGLVPEAPAVAQLQAEGTGPALFCICGLQAYRPLADALAPLIPVYGMFLPAEHLRVELQAAAYVRALREHQPAGPYVLAGFSFGGVIAYEMAQQLVDDGECVHHLTIMDCWLPSAVSRAGTVRSKLGRLRRIVRDPGSARERTVTRVMAAYRVRPYAGAVRVVRATQSLAELGPKLRDPAYGWGDYVARLELLDLPGDHVGILRDPAVRQLAVALRQDRCTFHSELM